MKERLSAVFVVACAACTATPSASPDVGVLQADASSEETPAAFNPYSAVDLPIQLLAHGGYLYWLAGTTPRAIRRIPEAGGNAETILVTAVGENLSYFEFNEEDLVWYSDFPVDPNAAWGHYAFAVPNGPRRSIDWDLRDGERQFVFRNLPTADSHNGIKTRLVAVADADPTDHTIVDEIDGYTAVQIADGYIYWSEHGPATTAGPYPEHHARIARVAETGGPIEVLYSEDKSTDEVIDTLVGVQGTRLTWVRTYLPFSVDCEDFSSDLVTRDGTDPLTTIASDYDIACSLTGDTFVCERGGWSGNCYRPTTLETRTAWNGSPKTFGSGLYYDPVLGDSRLFWLEQGKKQILPDTPGVLHVAPR